MTVNRSLDEFADAGEGDATDGERATDDRTGGGGPPADAGVEDSGTGGHAIGGGPVDAAGGSDEATPADEGEPERPTSTYVWRPDGGPCGACGETVVERWRSGDDLVCGSCKEW